MLDVLKAFYIGYLLWLDHHNHPIKINIAIIPSVKRGN